MRASPEIEHVKALDVAVTQFSPLETVIVAPPKLEVKVIDRVATGRSTVSDVLLELVVNSADVVVVYPVADPLRV